MRQPRLLRSGPGGATGCAGSRRPRAGNGVAPGTPAQPRRSRPGPPGPGPLCPRPLLSPGERGAPAPAACSGERREAPGGTGLGRLPGHGGAGSPAGLPVAGGADGAARPALAAALLAGLAAAGPDGRSERGTHRGAAGAGVRRAGRAASAGGWHCPAPRGTGTPAPWPVRWAGQAGLGGRRPRADPVRSPIFHVTHFPDRPFCGAGSCRRSVFAKGWMRALERPEGSPALLILGLSSLSQLPALCQCSFCSRAVWPVFFLHGLLCLLHPGHRQGRDAGSHSHHVTACLLLRVPRACLCHPARLPLRLHPAGHGASAPR